MVPEENVLILRKITLKYLGTQDGTQNLVSNL